MKLVTQAPTLDASGRVVPIVIGARELLNGAEEIRRRTRTAIGEAARIGKQLADEKEWVEKVYGRGQWEKYFDLHFSKTIAVRTAQHWMKLGAIALAIKSYDSRKLQNKIGADSVSKEEVKSLRLGMRALEIGMPPARTQAEAQAPTQAGADVVITIRKSHVTYINYLIADINRLKGESPKSGKVQSVLRDYEPLLKAISSLRELA